MSLTGIETRQDQLGLGIAMMLAAWFMFSLVDTSVKWLVLLGLPAMQLSFMRYLVQFVFSVGMVARHGAALSGISRHQAILLTIRGALLVSATVLNFIALKYLPLTVTSAIMFSAPIIVSALSVPLLGERVGIWRWSAIMVGFLGVLVVIRPFGEDFHWATIMIVYNAVALALFSIITRKLSGEVPSETMQIYMGALGTITLLPFAIWTWQNPETLRDWALLFGLGFFAWIGHEVFTRAHAKAEASVLMPFSYSFLIYLTITSYLVFGDLPDGATMAGACLIVLSGLLIWWRENQKAAAHVG